MLVLSLCIAIATVYLQEPDKTCVQPNFYVTLNILVLLGMLVLPNALRKMRIAQNKVIRFINSLGPKSRITADTLRELNLLNVETQVKQLRLTHVHKFVYELCPTYLK